MDFKVAGMALAIVSLANVIGTYISGHLGGLLRRKYLLSVLYTIRSGAMLLFLMVPLSQRVGVLPGDGNRVVGDCAADNRFGVAGIRRPLYHDAIWRRVLRRHLGGHFIAALNR